ncbi:MAG: hypothetical protein KBD53_06920 [Candidatus Omnitrophica bacterium]|nr:hypothetical protein [Candidatus Omnitrophota bacterium]
MKKLNILFALFIGSLISTAVVSAEEMAVEAAPAVEAVVEAAAPVAAEAVAVEEAVVPAVIEAGVPATEEAVAATSVSGAIVSINIDEQYVVIDSGVEGKDGMTETAIFYFTDAVKILKGDAEVAASNLVEGDKVSIEYTTDEDGNKVVSTITVQ